MKTFAARVLLLPWWLLGCTGTIEPLAGGEGRGQGSPGGSGRPTGSSRGGATGTSPERYACPAEARPAPGPAPLRRLTRAEYDSTVLDLLGDDSRPARDFPPESTVHGFDNNVVTQTVTYTLADYYFKAAERLASRAVTRLASLLPCSPAVAGERACAEQFVRRFGLRAYRRPLEETEVQGLLGTYDRGRMSGDFANGVRLVLVRMLSSPHFLYRPEFGEPGGAGETVALSQYELATRLSYLLWGTMPDAELFEAAERRELDTSEHLRAQVGRMLRDDRARVAVRRFYSGWLMLDALDRASKDEAGYPGFERVKPAMREEIHALMNDLVWGEDDRAGRLYTTDYTYMNRELAAFLGMPLDDSMGAGMSRVALDPTGAPGPGRRVGILTTPALLAGHGKPHETSPVLRGAFVLEHFLCMPMPPPPPDVMPIEASDTSGLTTRERFELHAEAACASCHRFLDPMGFAFENFDTAGRYRAMDNGKPVHTAGVLEGTDVDGPFADGVELSLRLARSDAARDCIAKQWFRHAMGREVVGADERSMAQLQCRFNGPEARWRELFAAIAETDGFRFLTTAGRTQP